MTIRGTSGKRGRARPAVWRRAAAAGVLLAALSALPACTDRSERADRARALADAATRQVTGAETLGPAERALQMSSVEDRALANAAIRDTEVRQPPVRRFVAGSIVAKPKAVQPAPSALMMAQSAPMGALPALKLKPGAKLEMLEDVNAMGAARLRAGEQEVVPRIALRPGEAAAGPMRLEQAMRPETLRSFEAQRPQALDRAGERLEVRRAPVPGAPPLPPPAPAPAPSPAEEGEGGDAPLVSRGLAQAPLAIEPVLAPVPRAPEALLGQPQERLMARRSVVLPETLDAQLQARGKMIDVMAEYGLSGTVQPSRTGQMVIELDGVAPTQLSEAGDSVPAGPRPRLISEPLGEEIECPDDLPIEEIKADPALATVCVIERLRRTNEFEYVEKDYVFQHQFGSRPPPPAEPVVRDVVPSDPLWSLQWNLQRNGESLNESPGGSSFVDFWTRTGSQGDRSVVVAVVDTGLQAGHPDIERGGNIAPGWDFIRDRDTAGDGDGRDPDATDVGDACPDDGDMARDTFHGTHVAGIIGAAQADNGAGIAGGAWEVTVVPVRAVGRCGGAMSDITEGIRWAAGTVPAIDADGTEVWNANPAHIINLSLGQFGSCPAAMQEAIDDAVDAGAIVVAAAGNARVSTQYFAPGGCRNVVSVAASDARGVLAPYSNFGEDVDLLAPGGDVFRDDNGDNRPDGILSTKAASECYDPLTRAGVENCFYAFEEGTSMAAPHVSAALALMRGRYPDRTPDELVALLGRATSPREPEQCSDVCEPFLGTIPIEGSTDQCALPCGAGLLDLALLPDE